MGLDLAVALSGMRKSLTALVDNGRIELGTPESAELIRATEILTLVVEGPSGSSSSEESALTEYLAHA